NSSFLIWFWFFILNSSFFILAESGAHLTESCAGMQFLTRKEMGDFSLFEGLFESHQGRGEPRIGKIS
ncbi:MAG TPA: hypothetical protein PLB18_01105, partial [Acidobacteriota bacterium]|nr:hypothetical protein [Acidobacteriota bacterium]